MNEFNSIGNETQEKPTESKAFTILAIIFFVVGILISLLQLLVNEAITSGTTNKLGYILGSIIGRILFVAFLVFIARFVFKKKKGLALMIISVIFFALSIIVTSSALVKRSEEIRLNKVAMNKFASIANDYAAGRDLTNEKFKESNYGSLAPFLNLSEQYFISFKKLNTDLTTEINGLNLETILGADSYSSPEKIKSSQKRLSTTMSTFNQFEANANKSIKNLQSDVNNLNLSIKFKEGFVTGFQKSQLESNDKFKNYMEIEKSVIKKMDELMSFMLTQNGNYQVKNNNIYFKSNDTLDKYNKYIDELQKLAAQETSAQKEIQNSMTQKIDDLNQVSK